MQKAIYVRCRQCGLIHFAQEQTCPRCGYSGLSPYVDRYEIGFSEALEYAYALSKDSLFNYSLCQSLVADFAPHLHQDWHILLRTSFDCGAIEELRTESGLEKDPYERAKQRLSRFLRDNDSDYILSAYMKCLYPERNLPRHNMEQEGDEAFRGVMQDLVNCLAQIVSLKRLENSGALQDQISSLENQLRMLKRYSANNRA